MKIIFLFFLDTGSENKKWNKAHKIHLSRLEYLSLSKKMMFFFSEQVRGNMHTHTLFHIKAQEYLQKYLDKRYKNSSG